MKYVIISRHPAAIAFIRETDSRFAEAPVVEQATAADVFRAEVAGNLPMHLAVLAAAVTVVEFDGQPPRGQEYDLAAMKAAGAKLRRYGLLSLPTDMTRDQYLNSGGFAI